MFVEREGGMCRGGSAGGCGPCRRVASCCGRVSVSNRLTTTIHGCLDALLKSPSSRLRARRRPKTSTVQSRADTVRNIRDDAARAATPLRSPSRSGGVQGEHKGKPGCARLGSRRRLFRHCVRSPLWVRGEGIGREVLRWTGGYHTASNVRPTGRPSTAGLNAERERACRRRGARGCGRGGGGTGQRRVSAWGCAEEGRQGRLLGRLYNKTRQELNETAATKRPSAYASTT